MSLLNSDVLFTIFDALRFPPSSFYQDAVFKDTRFYRAMISVGLAPPLPTGDNLATCTLVCRAWRGPAQCVMRRHIRIKTWAQCRHILSITSNPAVGRGIHSLDFTGLNKGRKQRRVLSSELVTLLQSCPNLRTLRVDGSVATEGMLRMLLYSNTVFPHLTALDLGWGKVFEKLILGQWLDTMPSLRVLAIGDVSDGFDENYEITTALPPSCQLQAVVPYKLSFQHYEWLLAASKDTLVALFPASMWYQSGADDHHHSLHAALTSCGSRLEWLSFDCLHYAATFISHCPRLAHLRLPLDDGCFDAQALEDALKASLSPISSLTVCSDLRLSPRHVRWLIENVANNGALCQLQSLSLELRVDKKYTAFPATIGEIEALRQLCHERQVMFRCPDLQSLISGIAESGAIVIF